MTYEEFKQFADGAIMAGLNKKRIEDDLAYKKRLLDKVKNGEAIAYKGRVVLNEKDAEAFKTLLSVCICMTTIAKDNVHKYFDLYKCTCDSTKREKHGLKERFCEDKYNRKLGDKLKELCSKYDKDLMSFAKNGQMEDVLLMCDEIDKAEELISPMVEAYKRLMMHKITIKTLSTPLDPVLLNQMIISFTLISICRILYGSFLYNFSAIEHTPALHFLKMDDIFNHLNKMLMKLDYHDTNMKPLKTNINSLCRAKEAQSICDDIIAMVLSLDFTRELLLVGNPELKIEPEHHVSMMPSLDKITLTPEEYKDKYSNMFRYDKAV